MRRMCRRAIVAFAVVGTGGCRATETVCPSITAPAIDLTVVDSVTGRPLTVVPTVFAVNAGDTLTTLFPGSMENRYPLGLGRSGSFRVVVKAPGYVDWSLSRVDVTANGCGLPQTVSLLARLQR